MAINRSFFVVNAKQTLFDGSIKTSQVSGLKIFLDYWETKHADKDDRWFAYILGTVHHETGRSFLPVRETFAKTDKDAIRILNKSFGSGKLTWVKKPYWDFDLDGKSWIGRGYCQITHKKNYQNVSKLINYDLLYDPNSALKPEIAVKVAVEGMIKGIFTGKSLADFFMGSKSDWKNARRIINGLERADLVASYAKKYYSCISYTTI